MKKSLVLAMAMALGVTASAYAANPFSDVPAGHWAYDSIDKLAAAGVIDGMGDGTYQGDKTMTRYEMAQIVAKAMAKGANVDKLAAEFADELDNLGVRVANLEKKADNVKISGNITMAYWAYEGETRKGREYRTRLRSDLNITGTINENWTYNATLRNEQYLHDEGKYTYKGKGEEETRFLNANVTGRIGGLKVLAGRYTEGLEDYMLFTDQVDGVVVSYGKKVKATVGYGTITPTASLCGTGPYDVSNDKLIYGRVDTKLGKVGAHVGAYKIKDSDRNNQAAVGWTSASDELDNAIYTVGFNAPVAKNVSMDFTFMKAENKDSNGDNKGYVANVYYKGANRNKVGSYGLFARYQDQAYTTTPYGLPGPFGLYNLSGYGCYGTADDAGFKGTTLGVSYVPAKRVTLNLEYSAFEAKATGNHADTIYMSANFRF